LKRGEKSEKRKGDHYLVNVMLKRDPGENCVTRGGSFVGEKVGEEKYCQWLGQFPEVGESKTRRTARNI